MLKKLMVMAFGALFIFSACEKQAEKPPVVENLPPGTRTVVVEEVVQVSSYTYLRVTEGDKEFWMAVTKSGVQKGETVYFMGAVEMKNFESKELNKTFDSILFVQEVARASEVQEAKEKANTPQKPDIKKTEVTVDKAPGGITIGELYTDMKKYDGKSVKIRGKIVKVNMGIMNTNWYHIQDGTSSGENFDLTVTSNQEFQDGAVVTFEGKIAVNKDFGYGYEYKVILEQAKASSKSL